MIGIADLPTLNATLNATSAVLLATGYLFIRGGNKRAHVRCMLAAVITSLLFLTSYIVYHVNVGSKHYEGTGIARTIYLSILGSHTVLAVAIVPLVIITLTRALKGRFAQHKKIARWTLPLWFYVSVTGVIVYWMLYHRTP